MSLRLQKICELRVSTISAWTNDITRQTSKTAGTQQNSLTNPHAENDDVVYVQEGMNLYLLFSRPQSGSPREVARRRHMPATEYLCRWVLETTMGMNGLWPGTMTTLLSLGDHAAERKRR
jgi:hypothetical protein